MNIELLDSIYERYGYEVKKSHVGVRVYIFTKSIYSGAEIIVTDSQSCNIEQLRKEYSDSGYAVKVRQYKSIEEATTYAVSVLNILGPNDTTLESIS